MTLLNPIWGLWGALTLLILIGPTGGIWGRGGAGIWGRGGFGVFGGPGTLLNPLWGLWGSYDPIKPYLGSLGSL